MTLVVYAVLAVVVVGGLFLLAARLLPAGEQIAPPVRDEPVWTLPPERALVAEDVATVRLPVALRGYRFAETDMLLDRLTEELRLRDAEIARLQAAASGSAVAADLAPETEREPESASESGSEQRGSTAPVVSGSAVRAEPGTAGPLASETAGPGTAGPADPETAERGASETVGPAEPGTVQPRDR